MIHAKETEIQSKTREKCNIETTTIFDQEKQLIQGQEMRNDGVIVCHPDICSDNFTQSGSLNKQSQSGGKPYQCDICSAVFARSGHLKNHKRSHSGEKPYQCDICSASFAQSGHLKTHKRSHS